ncbi:MAG TPA: hypothetical protein VFO97_05365 [Desertimonas sp.]|nr:hypothetical protein [Desertimonas sp.]
MKLLDVDFPGHFCAVPWSDPVVEAVGFGFDHAYVELLWLPVVGPSSTWIFRRLGARVSQHPDGVDIDLAELSNSMGLGDVVGSTSTVQRSLRRLLRFGLASWQGRLAVRTAVPPLAARNLDRLPGELRLIHQSLVGGRCGGLVAQRPDPT